MTSLFDLRLLSKGSHCKAGLIKSADLLTPSEPDAGSSAPDGNITGGNGESLVHGRIWSGSLKLLLPALMQSCTEVINNSIHTCGQF